MIAVGDIPDSRHRANCNLRRAGFEKSVIISPVGPAPAKFLKRNQLRHNGDLAGLDFFVNRTLARILLFRGFIEALNPVIIILCGSWLNIF